MSSPRVTPPSEWLSKTIAKIHGGSGDSPSVSVDLSREREGPSRDLGAWPEGMTCRGHWRWFTELTHTAHLVSHP